MEQRSEHQYLPLGGAATDPAYVPGLVPARAVAPEETREEGAVPEADEADGVRAAAEKEVAGVGAALADAGVRGLEDESGAEADAAADTDMASTADGGPSCEMSDRQGSFVADSRGVRLRLADEEADFRWDELSAVEYSTPRWSRRFEIVVYTPERRRFSHDVQAADRATLTEWTEQLEAVLDAYFEE
ncbi:hypothetical protein ACFYMW_06430 [Streptomyces sp. NPDC006692]|uniref:hypothetical protein n=1 Tax=unclassified Streptomyces TaxID=2593676 RepID=UPI0036AE12A7